MSHTNPNNDEDGGIMLKARPRRPFELSSASSSTPPAGLGHSHPSASNLQAPVSTMDGSGTPSRTRSILNLTSSTLFGIYQPTGYATEREEPSTPWGTGAETPAESRHAPLDLSKARFPTSSLQEEPNGRVKRRRNTIPHTHQAPRRGFKRYYLPLAGRVLALFTAGVLYGLLITHLHDRQELAPVKVEQINRTGWPYLSFWGAAGVLFGEALPWIDRFWAPHEDDEAIDVVDAQQRNSRGLGGWNDIVRSIGAFVGIAFAIRKLPWQSTMQLSLTLALANPAVWYLIDRSPPGFVLSAAVSLSGTAVLLGINPAWVPSPSPSPVQGTLGHAAVNGSISDPAWGANREDLFLGAFSQESIGVATWIASVLFVSSVCFGNIGRRLAPKKL